MFVQIGDDDFAARLDNARHFFDRNFGVFDVVQVHICKGIIYSLRKNRQIVLIS